MSDTVNKFPNGWSEARVRAAIKHYESHTEDEAAYEEQSQTMMVPRDLIPPQRCCWQGWAIARLANGNA